MLKKGKVYCTCSYSRMRQLCFEEKTLVLSDEDFPSFDVIERFALSISEDKDYVYVKADMPGLKSEDIELTFEKGTLWIRGERK